MRSPGIRQKARTMLSCCRRLFDRLNHEGVRSHFPFFGGRYGPLLECFWQF